MTHYAIIEPELRKIRLGDFDTCSDALKDAGLESGGVDFGTIARWRDGRSLSIIVFEFGLLEPKSPAYFALEGQLYNGNAVLFMADEEGETIDFLSALARRLKFHWYASAIEAEAGIAKGEVARPATAINGETLWEWKGSTS